MAVLTSEADKSIDEHPQPDTYESGREAGRRLSAPAFAAIALGVVVAALITYSLLRIAGEEHYQSCVSAVNGRYGTASDPLTRLARLNSVKACSRSPF